MEAISIGFVFIGYILLRLMLGHHHTPTMRDTKLYDAYITRVGKKEYAETLPMIEETLLKYPESAVCWALKAACHLGLREYHQAILYADKALHIDYNLPETYYHKALSYFYLGFSEEAMVEFNKAIWYSREQHSDSFYYKGILLSEREDHENARWAFEKATKLGHEKANYELLRLENRMVNPN